MIARSVSIETERLSLDLPPVTALITDPHPYIHRPWRQPRRYPRPDSRRIRYPGVGDFVSHVEDVEDFGGEVD